MKEIEFYIDKGSELMIIADYINSVLWLRTEEYEELYHRSNLPTKLNNLSWEDITQADDDVPTVYADFYPNGDTKVYFQLWIGDCCYIDDIVPITETEKKILWEQFKVTAKYQETSIKELFEDLAKYREAV